MQGGLLSITRIGAHLGRGKRCGQRYALQRSLTSTYCWSMSLKSMLKSYPFFLRTMYTWWPQRRYHCWDGRRWAFAELTTSPSKYLARRQPPCFPWWKESYNSSDPSVYETEPSKAVSTVWGLIFVLSGEISDILSDVMQGQARDHSSCHLNVRHRARVTPIRCKNNIYRTRSECRHSKRSKLVYIVKACWGTNVVISSKSNASAPSRNRTWRTMRLVGIKVLRNTFNSNDSRKGKWIMVALGW